jgi:hypothetical protein
MSTIRWPVNDFSERNMKDQTIRSYVAVLMTATEIETTGSAAKIGKGRA